MFKYLATIYGEIKMRVCDTEVYVFDSLSRIPDCEVISAVRFFSVRFVPKRYTLQQSVWIIEDEVAC